MPLIGPLWAWLVGLLGSVVSSVTTWLVAKMAYEKAVHYAMISAFLIAAFGLFLALTLSVKTMLFTARVAMPASLGQATYFLPGSIAQIFATIVTARVSLSVYQWTVTTMKAYVPSIGNFGQGMRL